MSEWDRRRIADDSDFSTKLLWTVGNIIVDNGNSTIEETVNTILSFL